MALKDVLQGIGKGAQATGRALQPLGEGLAEGWVSTFNPRLYESNLDEALRAEQQAEWERRDALGLERALEAEQRGQEWQRELGDIGFERQLELGELGRTANIESQQRAQEARAAEAGKERQLRRDIAGMREPRAAKDPRVSVWQKQVKAADDILLDPFANEAQKIEAGRLKASAWENLESIGAPTVAEPIAAPVPTGLPGTEGMTPQEILDNALASPATTPQAQAIQQQYMDYALENGAVMMQGPELPPQPGEFYGAGGQLRRMETAGERSQQAMGDLEEWLRSAHTGAPVTPRRAKAAERRARRQ